MNTEIIELDKLYFDPNNYRLRSNKNYNFVSTSNLLLKTTQKKTLNLIRGENNNQIRDLIESIKANGYLKVDNILVRKIKKDQYVVIEGNRRLAALKFLKGEHEKENNIGKLDIKILTKGIEAVLYDYADEKDYLILMGLKHVSGNKKWERYNQAKLLHELKTIMHLTEGEIAAKIGITKAQVLKEIRGYMATEIFIEETKDENFESFNPYDKIMIMIQLTDKPKLRKWIGWDDNKGTFTNKSNKKRFFTWVKPEMVYDEETEEYIELDPIIVSHKEVRELEEIIDDEEALEIMETQRSIETALETNLHYTKKQFSRSIRNVEKILINLKAGSSLKISTAEKNSLNNIISICKKFLTS